MVSKPLAQEGDWAAYLDEDNTGLIYYFNKVSGESLWVPPTDTFPTPKLSRKEKNLAESKQKEYRAASAKAAAAQEEEEESKGGGFFGALFDSKDDEEEDTATKQEEKESDEPNWFDGLFENKEEEEVEVQTTAETTTTTTAPEEESSSIFGSFFGNNDDNEPAPTLGSIFGGANGGDSKDDVGTAAVVEEEAPASAPAFSFFGGNKPAETKQLNVADIVAEEEQDEEPEKPGLGSLFSAFGGPTKSVDSDPVVNGDAVEETKKQELTMPSFSFGKSVAPKTDSEPKTKEPPAKKELTMPSFSFGKSVVPKVQEEAATLERKMEVKPKKQQQVAVVDASPIDTTLQIEMSSYVLPHPAKVRWGGEDAVFVQGRNFGVFDGVTGADKLDGVPLYSKTLATSMRKSMSQEAATMGQLSSNLLSAAEFADQSATGASTAIVGSITEDGKLRVLTLGDSLCCVIRGNKMLAKSREISHFFDCPYQLSEDSPDRPRDGTKMNVQLKPGDIVLAASDGVFDNMSDESIVDTVVNVPTARASFIAKKVVDTSRTVMTDDTAETPYAKLAKRNGMEDFQSGLGGKLDDTSCVVVRCI